MSPKTMLIIGGVVVGFITLFISAWLGVLIILGAIAAPTIAYFMLDPSQRKRVRAQGRKRIGS